MRVLLVDDHVELRRTMRRVLEGHDGVEVVGEAGDGAEALEVVVGARPDVVLMDVNLPDIGGAECATRMKLLFPRLRVVAWSGEMWGEAEMLSAGADAFVLKGDPTAMVFDALMGTRQST